MPLPFFSSRLFSRFASERGSFRVHMGLILALILSCVAFRGAAADPEERLSDQMAEAYRIQPGMKVEQLMELFVREPGLVHVVTDDDWHEISVSNDASAWKKIDLIAYTFRLKRNGLIKIDVKFVSPHHELWDQKPGTLIKWVSKPYLQRPILDETL